MDNLEFLLPYVQSGTAEGDIHFLDEIFVMPDNLANIIALPPGGISIVVGHKGIGKSALMRKLFSANKEAGIKGIFIKPDSIKKVMVTGEASLSQLKSLYFDALLDAVLEEIGKQLSNFIIKDDDKEIYMALRNSGKKDDDFVQKILRLLANIATPITKINFEKIVESLTRKKNPSSEALLNAINSRIGKGAEQVFYIFIDDTDQITISSDDKELNKIWGLLQAVRELCMNCKDIRVILSLRASIWSRMNEESLIIQNEQMDHFRNYQVDLYVSDILIRQIYEKRLLAARLDLNKNSPKQYSDNYDAFFENQDVKLPTSQERRYWYDFIVKSSRNRPRDAIQLIKHLIDNAKNRKVETLESLSLIPKKLEEEMKRPLKIDDADVDKAMNDYSEERLDDISKEYVSDCKEIKDILHRFSSFDFESNFDDLIKFLKGIPGGVTANLRGEILKANDPEHAIKLLKFLHEIGFINPKIVNPETKKFKHFLFEQENNFVSKGNIDRMKQCRWEIHPSFRSALIAYRKMLSI